jgi:hypothetical protein
MAQADAQPRRIEPRGEPVVADLRGARYVVPDDGGNHRADDDAGAEKAPVIRGRTHGCGEARKSFRRSSGHHIGGATPGLASMEIRQQVLIGK